MAIGDCCERMNGLQRSGKGCPRALGRDAQISGLDGGVRIRDITPAITSRESIARGGGRLTSPPSPDFFPPGM
jgi:hypothetical protein